MKTRAASAPVAADAPAVGSSVEEVLRTVPSVAAWVLSASYGAIR